MYGIWLKRLGRAAAVTAIAGAATLCVATAAEARNDGYWNGRWHHHHHYWAPERDWRYQSYYYAPRYYYSEPAWAYTAPYYGPPSLNFTIPLR